MIGAVTTITPVHENGFKPRIKRIDGFLRFRHNQIYKDTDGMEKKRTKQLLPEQFDPIC